MSRSSLIALLGLLLAGCLRQAGSPASHTVIHHSATVAAPATNFGLALPLPANAAAVPLVRQRVNYSCGTVAALSILRYWKPETFASAQESNLYGPMHTTPQDGTDPLAIVDYLSHVPGMSAELRFNTSLPDLIAAVDHGEPAIVNIQAWKDESREIPLKEWGADWDDGHYAVIVGYDDRALYFMDPSTSDHYAYIPRSEFEARWHDALTGSNKHIFHATIFVHGAHRASTTPLSADATRLR